jgi:hypothetical protein
VSPPFLTACWQAYLGANFMPSDINQMANTMSDQPAEDVGALAALSALAVVLVLLVIAVLGAFLMIGPPADHFLFLGG